MEKMKRLWIIRATATLAAIFAVTSGAGAHHSANAEFYLDKNIAVTGTLTKVELINPHSFLHFDIKNAAGKVEPWDFATAAPSVLKRAGLSVRDTLKVGDNYKIVYSPAKRGERFGLLHSLLLPDGRLLAFGAANNVDAARELSK
jgi:hypothetical protein